MTKLMRTQKIRDDVGLANARKAVKVTTAYEAVMTGTPASVAPVHWLCVGSEAFITPQGNIAVALGVGIFALAEVPVILDDLVRRG